MGHHYLPQYYLKGFADNNDMLWVYEKGSDKKFNTQIKSAANITKLYNSDFEQYMADNIEGPANTVLTKIRNKSSIDHTDREILSGYIWTIWKRVPKALERFKQSVPDVGKRLYEKINNNLKIVASQEPEKTYLIDKFRENVKTVLDDLTDDPPKDLWEYSIPPEKTPRAVEVLNNMTWQFLVIDDIDKEVFLTCDNPVFFFQGIGVGNQQSELSFPISSKIALWSTWRKEGTQDYINITKQATREINRRTVSNASRYVFHSRDEYWIQTFVNRGKWQLNRFS